MISRVRRILSVGFMGAAVSAAALAVPDAAVAAPADDGMPPWGVETFEYPNAAKILKEQGIALRKGDGHIVLADCRATTDIQVMTAFKHPGQTRQGWYCFNVTGTGKTGWLTLEVPQAYTIATGDYALDVKVDSKNGQEQVKVAKNSYKGLGKGLNPLNPDTMLVELRVTG
ncbi:hypothetical protein ACFP1Z_14890 [Streptomyces gamaensis]|uniref:Secreted protein n=1 Tax=Streptomyces gamaensis TaxID=1763542 RepID=A0ABW0Z260_9ACTN